MRIFTLIAGILCSAPFLARAQYGDDICKSMNQGKFWQAQRGQGDPQTMFCAGMWHELGTGVQKNPSTAANYYRRAAESGYAPAQTALVVLYKKGAGVPQDYAEAIKWLRKAASQGFAPAQNDLGVAYTNGQGVPKDMNEAARLYRLAAANGSATAANTLAALEKASRPQRKEPAEDLFNEGARLYAAGNKAAAVKPFMTAAQAGNSLAQFWIGYQYEFRRRATQELYRGGQVVQKVCGRGIRNGPKESRQAL